MKDNTTLSAFRTMAWERGKGELKSMLHTYYGDDSNHKEFKAKLREFIEYVEDRGLQE